MSLTVLRHFLRRIRSAQSGVAAVEFAMAAPLLLTVGLWGVESTNRAVTQMRLSQIAVLIADNASRIGEESLLGEVKIFESDIGDVIYGAHVQAGDKFDLYEHGRVILSSLEVYPDTDDQQYIHWQRCKGKKDYASSYGDQGAGADGSLVGMGPAGAEISAFDDEAVMFVEVVYDYQPIISNVFTNFGGADKTLIATAAFNVRDNRDLSQIYQRDPVQPDPVLSCDLHDGI